MKKNCFPLAETVLEQDFMRITIITYYLWSAKLQVLFLLKSIQNSKGKTAYITKPDNVNIHVISDDLATSIEWIYTIDDFSASNYSRIVFYKNGEVAAQSQFKGEWKTVKLVTRT